MVIVPSFCPDVPALRKNPVFLYTEDNFKKPNPFAPDVVVPIDPVIDLKVACIDALESQFYEWNPWLFGYLGDVPKDKAARLEWCLRSWEETFLRTNRSENVRNNSDVTRGYSHERT